MEHPKKLLGAAALTIVTGLYFGSGKEIQEVQHTSNETRAAVNAIVPTEHEIAVQDNIKTLVTDSDPELMEELKNDFILGQKALSGDTESIAALCNRIDEIANQLDTNAADAATYVEARRTLMGISNEEHGTMQRGYALNVVTQALDDEDFSAQADQLGELHYMRMQKDPDGYYSKTIMEIYAQALKLQAERGDDVFDPLFLGGAGMTKESLQDTVLMVTQYFTENPERTVNINIDNLKKAYDIK